MGLEDGSREEYELELEEKGEMSEPDRLRLRTIAMVVLLSVQSNIQRIINKKKTSKNWTGGVLRCHDALNHGGWGDLRDKREKDALYVAGLNTPGIR